MAMYSMGKVPFYVEDMIDCIIFKILIIIYKILLSFLYPFSIYFF